MTNEDSAYPGDANITGTRQDEATPPPPMVMAGASKTPWLRRRGAVVAAGVAGLLVLSGGAAFGTTAYAKHGVCAAVADDSSALVDVTDVDKETGAALGEVQDQLETKARMLVMNSDLRSAVRGLAGDVAQMQTLRQAIKADPGAGLGSYFAEMVSLFGSLNTHVRQIQQACDLPATGIPLKSDGESSPFGNGTTTAVADTASQADIEQQCQQTMDGLNQTLIETRQHRDSAMVDLLDPDSDLSSTQELIDSYNDQLHEIMDEQTTLEQSTECSGTQLDRWYY